MPRDPRRYYLDIDPLSLPPRAVGGVRVTTTIGVELENLNWARKHLPNLSALVNEVLRQMRGPEVEAPPEMMGEVRVAGAPAIVTSRSSSRVRGKAEPDPIAVREAAMAKLKEAMSKWYVEHWTRRGSDPPYYLYQQPVERARVTRGILKTNGVEVTDEQAAELAERLWAEVQANPPTLPMRSR